MNITGEATFLYTTVDDSAVAGSDFMGATSQQATFPVGMSQINISVNIVNDEVTFHTCNEVRLI